MTDRQWDEWLIAAARHLSTALLRDGNALNIDTLKTLAAILDNAATLMETESDD